MTLGNIAKLCEPQLLLVDIPGGIVVKNLPANAGDTRDTALIPRLGRSPGGGNGNPPQYSFGASLMTQMVKNLPAVWEIWV